MTAGGSVDLRLLVGWPGGVAAASSAAQGRGQPGPEEIVLTVLLRVCECVRACVRACALAWHGRADYY